MPAKVCADETVGGESVANREFRRSMVEQVAKVISGISVIGEARNALDAVGWTATIAANRITVDGQVLVQFIPGKIGIAGRSCARWAVYPVAGSDSMRIVGAEGLDGRQY
jgi:hypothetical protein